MPYILHAGPGVVEAVECACRREGRGMSTDAVVVGCGVVGLSTAIRLRESGLDARIVAAELPENTTSAVAAAIWYPYKAYPEDAVLQWGARTFEVFEDLARATGTGVRMREGVELRREVAGEPWWAGAVPGVRRCAEDELPSGYRDGHAFVVPVVEMPVYLRYLVDRFAAAGGEIEVRAIDRLEDLSGETRPPTTLGPTSGVASNPTAGGRRAPFRGRSQPAFWPARAACSRGGPCRLVPSRSHSLPSPRRTGFGAPGSSR